MDASKWVALWVLFAVFGGVLNGIRLARSEARGLEELAFMAGFVTVVGAMAFVTVATVAVVGAFAVLLS